MDPWAYPEDTWHGKEIEAEIVILCERVVIGAEPTQEMSGNVLRWRGAKEKLL